jgi:hypothetical protein
MTISCFAALAMTAKNRSPDGAQRNPGMNVMPTPGFRGACHRAALRADPLAHPARYPIYASNPLRLVTGGMKQ